jgi:pyruvate/2-oxoglutarate dehydrogenase complex dihydrolipoamide dehydrogenase (E3) component
MDFILGTAHFVAPAPSSSGPATRGRIDRAGRRAQPDRRRRGHPGRLVPYTVFVTPELARVGLTETEARRTGRRVAVAQIRVSAIPRAKTLHDTTGSWKVVVDADTGQILGAALLGHNAGEVISTLQVAVLGGLPYQRVRDAVLTHPTMGEGLNLLFDALADQPAHRAAHQPSSDEIPSG